MSAIEDSKKEEDEEDEEMEKIENFEESIDCEKYFRNTRESVNLT